MSMPEGLPPSVPAGVASLYPPPVADPPRPPPLPSGGEPDTEPEELETETEPEPEPEPEPTPAVAVPAAAPAAAPSRPLAAGPGSADNPGGQWGGVEVERGVRHTFHVDMEAPGGLLAGTWRVEDEPVHVMFSRGGLFGEGGLRTVHRLRQQEQEERGEEKAAAAGGGGTADSGEAGDGMSGGGGGEGAPPSGCCGPGGGRWREMVAKAFKFDMADRVADVKEWCHPPPYE
jgi:hypothetical protein